LPVDLMSRLIPIANSTKRLTRSAQIRNFAAEECDAILMGGITLGTQRGYAAEREIVARLSSQIRRTREHSDECDCGSA
jgi:hypothetical protein